MTASMPPKTHLSRAHILSLTKEMLRIRRFEEKCAELYTQEKIRGFLHLYIGEEAIAVGVNQALAPTDAIVKVCAVWPEGNDSRSEPSGRVRCTVCLSAPV